jgi:SAM-dependent methyltransferase
MGILLSHLHLLAAEQQNRPITGDVVTFGQQRVYASFEDTCSIFSQHSAQLHELPQGFDVGTKIPGDVAAHTNVQAVFKTLGADNVYVADFSDYENPDFIFDLNEPVDAQYENRFDAIFDSGTLEHVFDVPTALQNMVRILKPGGCVILGYPVSNCIDHGFYSFSPTLFFDFFAANGFSDFSCYLIEGSCHNLYLKSKVYQYTGVQGQFTLLSPRPVSMLFFARLDEKPAKITKPMQRLFVQWWEASQEKSTEPVQRRWGALKNLVRFAVDLIPARIRPEIIDATLFSNGTRFNKRDNLRFIGKY